MIWQQEEGAFGKLSGMFIIGHGMCGPTMMAFAGSTVQLVAGRAAMGASAALIYPATLALLSTTFVDRRERAQAI